MVVLAGSGFVYLETSPDKATWTTINSAGNSKTVGLNIGLNETVAYNVYGEVPAGYWCRLRSVVTGGSTAAYSNGQETYY